MNIKDLDNPNFKDKALLAELVEMFNGRPQAYEFLYKYGTYIEQIDDMVDEVKDIDRVETMTSLASDVFNCAYWKQWGHVLLVVEKLTHREYFDSVKWESSEFEWKRRDAKCMSHCGYNMLFAVIWIEFGDQKLKEISLKFRAHAHERHLQDPI